MLQIDVRNYPVFMKIGYRSEERFKAQNVLISVRLVVSPAGDPGQSDDLNQAVDYGQVAHLIEELLAGKEYKLIETAVHAVGRGIIQQFPAVLSARVSVEKTCLPQSQMKTSRVKISRDFSRENLS
jgi:dihydroneopterin aldolase